MQKVPEKYLQLNAVFQQLKSALSRHGIKQFDVEGILTGDTVAFLGLIRVILLPRINLQTKYTLSSDLSDYKFAETLFRICRKEFGIPVKLTIEQFLNCGNFTVKKIEFLIDLCNGLPDKSNNEAAATKTIPRTKSSILVVEEETQPIIQPTVLPPDPKLSKNDDRIDAVHACVCRMGKSLSLLEDKVLTTLETIEARMSILEGRLRIWDKLGPTTRDH